MRLCYERLRFSQKEGGLVRAMGGGSKEMIIREDHIRGVSCLTHTLFRSY